MGALAVDPFPARRADVGGSPPDFGFETADAGAWLRWRDRKWRDLPRGADALMVEIADPARLTPSEHDAITERCARWNMAIYATPPGAVPADDRIAHDAIRMLGAQIGLRRLDPNWLADADGVTSLRVSQDASPRGEYIPYTNQVIGWHTDGYYNPPQRRIRAMVLHCVQPAETGGENRLMDHEIAWLLLRERDPAHVRALCRPDAMTIPARESERPGGERLSPRAVRQAQSGPVFISDPDDGHLDMRYTARTRSIEWKPDDATRTARAALEAILAQDGPQVLRVRMEAGMGLICNNVLHDRSGFADSERQRRWVLRARYYDRVAACG